MLKVVVIDTYGDERVYNLDDRKDRNYLTERYGCRFMLSMRRMTPGQQLTIKCLEQIDDIRVI